MSSVARRLATIVERSPLQRVGPDERRGWWFLSLVQIGVTICVPVFALGGQLGQHMRFVDLLPALLTGTALTMLCCVLTGIVGVRARVPTALIVQRAFGREGGRLVAAIFIITLFGWFGVQTELLVRSIGALLEATAGVEPAPLPLTLACGLVMSSTAIIGVKALGKVAYLAVPLLLVVIGVPTGLVLSSRDLHAIAYAAPAAEPFSFGVAVSVVVGGYMVGNVVAPDLTRFLRAPRDVVVGCGVSLGLVLPTLIGVSALLAVAYGTGDLVALLVATSVGLPALAVIVLATWTSNDKNLYEAALSLATLLPNVERWKLTAIAGAVGTLVAATGIFQHFVVMLLALGITIGPIAGVYVADFALRRDAYAVDAVGAGERVRWSAVAAWLVGVAVGFATLPADQLGLDLGTLTRVPALDALLAAAASYCAFHTLAGMKTAARGFEA